MDAAALSWFCRRHWDTINERWKGELNNFAIQLCSPCDVCCRSVSSLCCSALHKSTWPCCCRDCTLQQFVCLLIKDKNGAVGVASQERRLFFFSFIGSHPLKAVATPGHPSCSHKIPIWLWFLNLIGPSVRKPLLNCRCCPGNDLMEMSMHWNALSISCGHLTCELTGSKELFMLRLST